MLRVGEDADIGLREGGGGCHGGRGRSVGESSRVSVSGGAKCDLDRRIRRFLYGL